MFKPKLKFRFMPPHVAYYQDLSKHHVFNSLCQRFRNVPVIYGLRCVVTGMIYVGSTMVPQDRFYQHLVTGRYSNAQLQDAINTYGLSKFTAIIFEVVDFPPNLSYKERKTYMVEREKHFISKFPSIQLYNVLYKSLQSPFEG